MIIINEYTGTWQRALCPRRASPRVGSYVRMPEEADAREYFDFTYILKMANKNLEFVRWLPRKKMNVYTVLKIK